MLLRIFNLFFFLKKSTLNIFKLYIGQVATIINYKRIINFSVVNDRIKTSSLINLKDITIDVVFSRLKCVWFTITLSQKPKEVKRSRCRTGFLSVELQD